MRNGRLTVADDRGWDFAAALADIMRQRWERPSHRVQARMWVFHRELVEAGRDYAEQKTQHDRVLARVTVQERAAGEKSAEVAQMKAIAENDDVYRARLLYRAAEQRVVAAREGLRILHAEQDDLRTQAADLRAADTFHAQERGQA